MEIQLIKGNIFSSKAQTLVNTINCKGVMGAGLALEFRLRYPEMYKKYVGLCEGNKIDIGILWLYKHSADKWILNFPTKNHWKYPTKTEYLHKGLKKFSDMYEEKGITSIAFPLLGSDKGGLSKDLSKSIMDKYLSDIPIKIEIYEFDPNLGDDDYIRFKEEFFQVGIDNIISDVGIKERYAVILEEALKNQKINSLSSLCSVKGIGIATVEKVYSYIN